MNVINCHHLKYKHIVVIFSIYNCHTYIYTYVHSSNNHLSHCDAISYFKFDVEHTNIIGIAFLLEHFIFVKFL